MLIVRILSILLIDVNIINSKFIINYETINKYKKTPRYQRHYVGSQRILETKYDRIFDLYTERYSFKLCLFEENDVFSNEISKKGKAKSIKLYKGIVCNEPTEIVIGSISNSTFHGAIYTKNSKIYYFEDIGKYRKDIDCSDYHSIAYSSDDIDNSLLKAYNLTCGNEQKREFKIDTSRISHRQINEKGSQSRSIPISKKWCEVAITIHWSYIVNYFSPESAISEIGRHFMILNHALTQQISNNNDPYIQYQISVISIANSTSIYEDSLSDSSKLLAKAAETAAQNKFCLHGVYVSKNWAGILGLAYTGNSQGTGICSNNAAYVVTNKVNEDYLPSPVHTVTTVHEIGHTLGSIHDPIEGCEPQNCFDISRKGECSPTRNFYLMSAFSTSGRDSNNLIYSPCSVEAISSIVTSPNRIFCLKAKVQNQCGNGIIEIGEECDSGFMEDKCCGSSSSSSPCKITRGDCSPSQGSCCESLSCLYRPANTDCGMISDCLIKSKCSGISAICPPAKFKLNDTICNNGSALCENGACTGSICKIFEKEECKCVGRSSCLVCCIATVNGVAACSPHSFHPNMENRNLPVGTTCTNGNINGLCSSNFECVGIVLNSPIFDLIKRLLTGDLWKLLTSIFTNYLEFVLIGLMGFLIVFSILARINNISTKRTLTQYRTELSKLRNRHAITTNVGNLNKKISVNTGLITDIPKSQEFSIIENCCNISNRNSNPPSETKEPKIIYHSSENDLKPFFNFNQNDRPIVNKILYTSRNNILNSLYSISSSHQSNTELYRSSNSFKDSDIENKCTLENKIRTIDKNYADINQDRKINMNQEIKTDINKNIASDQSQDLALYLNNDIQNDINCGNQEIISNKIASGMSQDLALDSNQNIQSNINNKIASGLSQDFALDLNQDINANLNPGMISTLNQDLALDSNQDITSNVNPGMLPTPSQDSALDLNQDINANLNPDMLPTLTHDLALDLNQDINANLNPGLMPTLSQDLALDLNQDIPGNLKNKSESNLSQGLVLKLNHNIQTDLNCYNPEILNNTIAFGLRQDLAIDLNQDIQNEKNESILSYTNHDAENTKNVNQIVDY